MVGWYIVTVLIYKKNIYKMQIEINNVKITLTKSQLEEIAKQTNNKNKPIEDRITDFNSVLKELKKETWKQPIKSPKTKEKKSINALAKIFLLTEAYNEGVVLDVTNTNQTKWYPYKYSSDGRLVVGFHYYICCVDLPLVSYYKNEKLCKDAYNKFKDIYDDFWMI